MAARRISLRVGPWLLHPRQCTATHCAGAQVHFEHLGRSVAAFDMHLDTKLRDSIRPEVLSAYEATLSRIWTWATAATAWGRRRPAPDAPLVLLAWLGFSHLDPDNVLSGLKGQPFVVSVPMLPDEGKTWGGVPVMAFNASETMDVDTSPPVRALRIRPRAQRGRVALYGRLEPDPIQRAVLMAHLRADGLT